MGMRGGGGVNTSQREWGVGELEFEALMRMLDNSVRNKISNVPVFFLYGAGCNDFDAGKSITRSIGKSGPRKSRLFGPNDTRFFSFVAISGPKKSRFSGPIPSKAPKWIFPLQNHYIPRHIKYKQQVH
jgi:hypothetical protein